MRRVVTWIVVPLVTLALVVVAVPYTRAIGMQAISDVLHRGDAQPAPGATADQPGGQPGSLVSSTPLAGFSHSIDGSRIDAFRVLYRSTSGDTGESTVVSGAVFAPKGRAPGADLPIISFGHGTTGIHEPCAPSLSDTLLGSAGTVAALTGAGYAVAFADYQGLGAPGVHPYTDAKTAGLNMIDAVRALRLQFGLPSTKWAAVGGSQGGGAAWAADEVAAGYAPDLKLVGALAISPAADVSGMVKKAQTGTLTVDQGPALQAIVESLATLHPDLDRDDYRRGGAAQYWDALSACSGPLALQRGAAAQAIGADDLKPASNAAADRLRGYLTAWALPKQKLSAPLFVWYGGTDTLVDADWTRNAIQRQCALGGTMQWQFEADKGHGEVDLATLMPWIGDRFAGKAALNACS
jgi:predicted esterase